MIRLHSRRLPALGPGGGPELVLWPGWGLGSAGWQAGGERWLTGLRRLGPVTLLDIDDPGPFCAESGLWQRLLETLPPRGVWLGWSLGGMLATAMAARFPQRCQQLVTLASNACFVARPGWPQGMPPEQFRRFRQELTDHPEQGWRQFLSLCARQPAAGRLDARQLLAALSEVAPVPASPREGLLRGLDWLAGLDLRSSLARLGVPVQHWLGRRDPLVPRAAAEALATLNPAAEVAELPAGHTLHAAATAELLASLRSLLRARGLLPTPRDKREVARAFGEAASTYDGAAHLQRRVARQLLAGLPETPGQWLDLGCGTGAALPALGAGGVPPLALDLAEGMVRHGRRHHPDARWLCGDAEALPLACASVDGVFSSLALQWCDDLAAVCRELARVLRPGGLALVATLGPATLGTLREAWAEVDDEVHVNRFAEAWEWHRALAGSGLVVRAWREQPEVLHYQDLATLARELRALGAHNVNQGRKRGLTGRRSWQRLQEAMARRRSPQGLPAEYQLWYLRLERREAS